MPGPKLVPPGLPQANLSSTFPVRIDSHIWHLYLKKTTKLDLGDIAFAARQYFDAT
jgi:hypothetical protein